MKTHTHYTIPTATAPWMRRNLAALAALLAVTAALVGLVFELGRYGLMTPNLMRHATSSPAHLLISTCRACADEMLGAAQISRRSLTLHTAIRSAATPRIASPRAFRDDVLGADQANLAFLSIDAPSQVMAPAAPATYQRIEGQRTFRDEVLGADQANLNFLTAPGSSFEPQQNSSGRVGPR